MLVTSSNTRKGILLNRPEQQGGGGKNFFGEFHRDGVGTVSNQAHIGLRKLSADLKGQCLCRKSLIVSTVKHADAAINTVEFGVRKNGLVHVLLFVACKHCREISLVTVSSQNRLSVIEISVVDQSFIVDQSLGRASHLLAVQRKGPSPDSVLVNLEMSPAYLWSTLQIFSFHARQASALARLTRNDLKPLFFGPGSG